MTTLFRLFKTGLCLGLLTLGAASAHADVLLLDDFDHDLDNPDGAATINSPALDYSTLFGSNGFAFYTANGNPGAAFSLGGWTDPTLAAALTDDSTNVLGGAGDYLTFTLTANSNVNWNQVSIDLASSLNADLGDTAPIEFSFRSSLDNFSSDLETGTLTSNYQTITYDSSTTLASGDSIEYRLYFWGAQDASDQVLVDNVTVAAVPESSSALLLAAGCVSLLVLVRRRNRA